MVDPRRILFVTDDPLLPGQMREALADMAGSWETSFAGSGVQALEAFARAPFHVVVSEVRMADMRGPEFLRKIMVHYPGTARFVLSASVDREANSELAELAHQFLTKPCDLGFLKSALRRTFQMGDRVRSGHARELVARIGHLPSVPALFLEINRLMDSERATADNLGAAIGRDIAMTAMILKLANSAFFGQRQSVATPAGAVAILGIDLLKSLVLAHGLFSQTGGFRLPSFRLDHLWRHSVAVASAAKQIAELEGLGRSAAAEHFTAGLLHDVGILVLASRFPEDYGRILETQRSAGCDLESAEFHLLGATHGEVGGYLLGLWGLPESVVEAAAFHHSPALQETETFSPALSVHIADCLLIDDPEHELFSTARLDRGYLDRLGLGGRIPTWRLNLEPDPAGLQEGFF